MLDAGRSETQVFADLIELTARPGYVHAIAYICHRDNLIAFQEEYKASELNRVFESERLIRTEITTLLGLMVRQQIDLTLPDAGTIQEYVTSTDTLMRELHETMSAPVFASMIAEAQAPTKIMASGSVQGQMMRESIFYGGESAYSFQYREFFVEKHTPDDHWLRANMGFDCSQARSLAKLMCSMMDSRATAVYRQVHETGVPPESVLWNFEYNPEEVAQLSGLPLDVVKAFFSALTLSGNNQDFNELGDYNALAGTPLIPTERGTVLLFLHYSIYEALYESPFFWMGSDKEYKPAAMANRGAFTEGLSERRLADVFGKTNVHRNVNILRGKQIVGEADVLVIYGDRVIIVQAKSKKLTLDARKGNDRLLRKDFAAAIQKANDQAWECANAILAGDCRMEDDQGKEVLLPKSIKEIFPFCIVSDHYPSLAFQASQYLNYQSTDVIRRPLVMDVFLLDVLAEMLSTPLHFLSYLRLRATAGDTLHVNHELTALGFHLKRNLWLDPQYNLVMLEDDIAGELDAAMTVRREGLPGPATPSGILTVMAGTLFEKLISQIERRPNPATLELGFSLLSMEEESCLNIHKGLLSIIAQTKSDGKNHNFFIGISSAPSGIFFHCNPAPTKETLLNFEDHCQKRKYWLKAPEIFGVSVDPDGAIQLGVHFSFPWERSTEMEEKIKDMKRPTTVAAAVKAFERNMRPQKQGRNDPCQCGSGKKHKKCCMT